MTLHTSFRCRTAVMPRLVLGVGLLLAQASPAHAMDLLQVYQIAQEQDATLQAARASTAAERERLPQARAQMLPNVSASWSKNRNQLQSTTPDFTGRERTTNTDYPSSNKSLSVRQPLYRPQLAAQYRQAQAQVDDAEAALNQEEQNLAVRVAGAYFEALLAKDQLALVLTLKTSLLSQRDAAGKALAAGTGTRTDIDDAQARLDMNAAQEIEARQNISFTEQSLQSLTNQPVGTLSLLNANALALQPPQPDQLEAWVARAQQHSPQLQSLQARVETARQEVSKARFGHYPTLDAVAQWTQSDSENVTNITNRYTNKLVGVQLNVPLFAGGYVNATVRQTLASQQRAEQTLEAARRDLSLRVQTEFRGVTENMAKARALEQALRSADQLVLSSRKSFAAGSRTVLDVLNAEQQRTVVQRDLSRARYVYLVSKIRLLALVGAADVDAIASLNEVLAP